VTTRVRVNDILREYARTASASEEPSLFAGEALGYVTPWNARGYEFATRFRHKFAFIAPVWLQIREDGKTKAPVLTGTHDVDRGWLDKVRGKDRDGPKIVPRVMYERNTLKSDDVPVIIDLLLALAKTHALDGFVFEIPIVEGTMDILLRMGEAFKDAKLLLLLVISRSSNAGRLPLTSEMLDQLRPLVHRFTMNAYDYQTPGPNAPFEWIQATIESFREQDRAKVLMGLPFYGYDNSGLYWTCVRGMRFLSID
jgi:chitinase domain-containing protein 1